MQLGQAADATDRDIARLHARLSGLYLERAREIVEQASLVGQRDNVVPLRAIA